MAAERYADYSAATISSGTPGRAFQRMGGNTLVIDDPAAPGYGGPGQAPNAAEYFLSGITGCAALMIERLAREDDVPLRHVEVTMDARMDREAQRDGPPVFASARMRFTFTGLTREQAGQLVETFKDR